MQALHLTYEILATTRNEAAVDVLLDALNRDEASTRSAALRALLKRPEPRASLQLLARWDTLTEQELRQLRSAAKWMNEAIVQGLVGDQAMVLNAIKAAKDLSVLDILPKLISLAESSGTLPIKQAACNAVLEMVVPLGRDARADRDQPTVRGPILARLVDSVRRYSMHRVDVLVDAYLLLSSWGDRDLRQMISSQPERELLRKRLGASKHPGVIELLAGYIRRRKQPAWINQLIRTRPDADFRNALLAQIGPEPAATVLRNLRELGMPKSCAGGETLLSSIPVELVPALIYVYNEINNDFAQALHMAAAAIESGDAGSLHAGVMAFTRCPVPEIDIWLRAAIPVADNDQEAIAADDNARLLHRLIELLGHGEVSVVRGVRRVLGPLHADEMLERLESLRPRSRRRLGRVVMMVDPDAIDRVRDTLRHPVLSKRLEAIAMADALAVVDTLSDSFARIAREDHLEARVRAAEAMSNASGPFTLSLLHEMVDLPECPVRDAAISALGNRQGKTR
jgi:hypothetical protein